MQRNSAIALVISIIGGILYLVVTVASKITQELAERIVLAFLALLVVFGFGMFVGAQTYFVLLKRREGKERERRESSRETRHQAAQYVSPYILPPSYFLPGTPASQQIIEPEPVVKRENRPPEWTVIGNPAVRTGRDL